MKQIIKPITKPFNEIVKSVALYNPNPEKPLKGMKRHKLHKKKKDSKKD